MTVTDTREPSRNYPVPAPGNNGADDIARLITALTMIGADVAALIAALSGKAAAAHGHAQADITGLVDALAGKAASGHTHGLDDLSDVEASGQAAYQVLAWIAGRWAPWTVDLAHVAGNGVLRLDGPQTLTAAEKLQGRSNLAAAALDSPNFTGAPTVPTPVITTDSNQAVNVTALRSAVANLVASSPAALDTLAELAAALGNDASFATTVTNALAAKQPLHAMLTALSTTAAGARAALSVPIAGAAPTLADAGFGTDFNVDLPSGWYTVTGVLDNGPAGTSTYIGVMLVIQRMFQSARSFQILLTVDAAWMRSGTLLSTTPSWGGWVKLAGLSDANTWSALQNMGAGLKVGGGSTLAKILTATASLDFPSIAAGSFQDLTITVAGAQINDSVALGLPSTVTAGLIFTAFVSAANTVKVRAANTTAAAIDPGAATVRATVFSF